MVAWNGENCKKTKQLLKLKHCEHIQTYYK